MSLPELKTSRPEIVAISIEAEVAAIGAALLDQDAAYELVEGLDREAFHREAHRHVYDAIRSLLDRSVGVDAVTVQAELQERGRLDEVGGVPYLAQLMDLSGGSVSQQPYHIGIVRDRAQRRRFIAAAQTFADWGRFREGDPGVLIDEAGAELSRIALGAGGRGLVRIGDMLWDEMAELEKRSRDGGSLVTGTPTGFGDLDRITAGLQPGDLIIAAGRPSMGKTAWALNVAQHVAVEKKQPVAIFSLEMSQSAVLGRILTSEARVDSTRFRTGRLQDDDYPRLAQAAGLLNTAPIFIDDTPAATVMAMRAKARRLRAEAGGLALVIVDYLQLVAGDGENRTQVVSEVSRGLKALAKELDVPVIALSQLSRAVETRTDKRPLMSDLRESGSIEQDADLVMFLYRPEYYHGATDKEGNSLEGRAELIIGKQRNGATGTVHLHFHKEYTRFEGVTRREGSS